MAIDEIEKELQKAGFPAKKIVKFVNEARAQLQKFIHEAEAPIRELEHKVEKEISKITLTPLETELQKLDRQLSQHLDPLQTLLEGFVQEASAVGVSLTASAS